MNKIIKNNVWIVFAGLFFIACNSENEYTPKPSAYYRISFPEKNYQTFDTNILPFTFEYPVYANVVLKKNEKDLKWLDIKFPTYNGVLFISHKKLKNPGMLAAEIDTAYQLLSLHFNMSSGVNERAYTDNQNSVYVNSYMLKGNNVASTYQFWATDSLTQFMRGAFYINGRPNYDSLEPVYKFIHGDIIHFLETLRWKK